MRRMRLLLGAAVALVALVGFAPHAWAQEGEGAVDPEEQEETIHHAEQVAEENGATHADVECIPILVEGGTVEDCQEAPNPLLPETNEIIWGAIGFAVVFFFLWKAGYPAIKKTMTERTERIRSEIESAEAQRAEADQVLADYRAQLADAKSEAGRIIEEARQAADAMKRDNEARLQAELAEMRQRAVADVEAAKGQALADLRSEVASLAVGAAEVVVQRSLDRDTQVQLIENYINQVGSQR